MTVAAFYLMVFLCDLGAGRCAWVDVPVAPFPTLDECLDEGVAAVLDDGTLMGYTCEERNLDR